MKVSRSRWLVAVVAACLVAFAVTACGGSSHSTGSSGASSSSGTSSGGLSSSQKTAVADAKAAFAKYTKTQPPISIPALPAKPPTGLNVVIASCALPVCQQETSPAVSAAKMLGWHVKTLQSALTPTAYQTTLSQILQDKPQYAAVTPIVPNSFVTKQISQIASEGTKVLEMSPPSDNPSTAGPVLAAVAGPPELSFSGQLMGDAVVSDANGPADTLFVWDPSFASTWEPTKAAFTKVIESAGGKVAVLQVSQANIGKSIPGQIVSYEQSHPDVKYIAFALSDFAIGVPEALKAASLSDKVKLLSRAPGAENMSEVKSGGEWVEVGEENATGGYRVVDQIARLAMHQPLPASLRNPVGWHQIYDQSNVTETSTSPDAPGVPKVFLKAWHVS